MHHDLTTSTNTVSSYKACPIFLIYFCFIMQEGLLCISPLNNLPVFFTISPKSQFQSRILVIQVSHVDRM